MTSMEKNKARIGLLSSCIAALAVSTVAFADDTSMTNPNDIKWGDAPPNLPKGAKIAVLHGDPGKEGPFTVRLKTPAGYKLAPHTHSQDENLTVISGAFHLGMGDTVDTKSAHVLKTGGYHYLPAKTPHYAFSKSPTVIQVSGSGPFDIVYINPADDPSKK